MKSREHKDREYSGNCQLCGSAFKRICQRKPDFCESCASLSGYQRTKKASELGVDLKKRDKSGDVAAVIFADEEKPARSAVQESAKTQPVADVASCACSVCGDTTRDLLRKTGRCIYCENTATMLSLYEQAYDAAMRLISVRMCSDKPAEHFKDHPAIQVNSFLNKVYVYIVDQEIFVKRSDKVFTPSRPMLSLKRGAAKAILPHNLAVTLVSYMTQPGFIGGIQDSWVRT